MGKTSNISGKSSQEGAGAKDTEDNFKIFLEFILGL